MRRGSSVAGFEACSMVLKSHIEFILIDYLRGFLKP